MILALLLGGDQARCQALARLQAFWPGRVGGLQRGLAAADVDEAVDGVEQRLVGDLKRRAVGAVCRGEVDLGQRRLG